MLLLPTTFVYACVLQNGSRRGIEGHAPDSDLDDVWRCDLGGGLGRRPGLGAGAGGVATVSGSWRFRGWGFQFSYRFWSGI